MISQRMSTQPIVIRQLVTADLPVAIELVQAEGWNQTETDWLTLLGNKCNVCLAAEANGKLVGTITSMNYANHVAWVGMVLVNKHYRGRGISKTLLNHLLNSLRACKSIKLDATPAGQCVYKKIGFRDEYSISRLICTDWNPPEHLSDVDGPQRIMASDVASIIEYDRLVFGVDRSKLIRTLIHEFPEKSFVLKRLNQIMGFALGRLGRKYHHIGPVMAESNDAAHQLISHALQKTSGQSVVLDVLNDKADLLAWLEGIGFKLQRGFTRMYLGENFFPGRVEKQQLICGPEFG